MNAAHVHLAINHLPVVGVMFGVLVLAGGALWRSEEIKKLALLCFVVVGLVGVPVYFSGEEAEEIVEHLSGVEHDRIEEHEEAGRWAAIVGGALGIAAAILLWLFRSPRRLPAWAIGMALVLSLVVAGVMARTATLGGEIRHEEIRSR